MPLFSVGAVRVTPILTTVQPQPPLEEIIFTESIIAPSPEAAKLAIGRKLDPKENLANVKFFVIPIALT